MDKFIQQLGIVSIERRPEACLGCGFEHGCSTHGCAVIKTASEQLKAYRATNHTPEECAAAFEELTAYRAAEQDGTLLRLPCKVGDTVYMTIHGFVEETKVRTLFLGHPSYNRGEPDPSIEMIRVTNYDLRLRNFGKTVFLTREDAEAALKEQEG